MVDIDWFNASTIPTAIQRVIVLTEFAWRLRDHRKTDILARIGGENFAIMMPETSTGSQKEPSYYSRLLNYRFKLPVVLMAH